MQQARNSVQAAANGFHGQLRVALSDGITPSLLPALLAACRQEEPEVEIRIFEVPLPQQIKGLHDDLYDVGFAQSDEVGDGIVALPVWSDVLMVAVPARNPLLAHKRISLGLTGAAHIATSREPGVLARFIERIQSIESPESPKPLRNHHSDPPEEPVPLRKSTCSCWRLR